jgi:hypothetical protein
MQSDPKNKQKFILMGDSDKNKTKPMLITMDMYYTLPCMMPDEYDVKMQCFTCSRNLNVMGYGKKTF